MSMQRTDIRDLKLNPMTLINEEWLLIIAQKKTVATTR